MPDAPIYLDHNATTPVAPEVVDAMLPFLREHFGNPASSHRYGRIAHEAVELARGRIAALIGGHPSEIVLTSGGTEANHLAVEGVAARSARRHLVRSAIEHGAVAGPIDRLESGGFTVSRIDVASDGRIPVGEVARVLSDDTALISLMTAHNETGVLQPVAEVARLGAAVGAIVHTDAAQAVGKIPIDVHALGVDLLTLAGHKLYAPKGVGVLWVRDGVSLAPRFLGGGQERGLRSGTVNVASAVGLGVACALAQERLDHTGRRLTSLRDQLHEGLRTRIPGLAMHGHVTERLPNTLLVTFPGATGASILARCPQVAASTGSACHDGTEAPNAVLVAMGVPTEVARGAVRLTLGHGTTQADVVRAIEALADAWHAQARPR